MFMELIKAEKGHSNAIPVYLEKRKIRCEINA
jgi:hypothetical protein